jgi:hypothetical protein
MGQVVPFIARVRDSGDWSHSERARLEDLADHLGQAGIDVEVVFGATDEGDPWCVVTDANGDVLIHVARIGGAFVVHSAVDDSLSEGADLHAALRERLAATEDAMAPHSAAVLPFDARQAQTLLALVVAAAFFYETTAPADAQAAELPHAPATTEEPAPPLAPHPDADTTVRDREAVARAGAAQDDDVPAPVAVAAPVGAQAPAQAPMEEAQALPAHLEPVAAAPTQVVPPAPAAPAEAPAPAQVIQGTDADDHLVGTQANEHILGGAGNDTLDGGGGHDTLDGGAGDDRIELRAGVVAIGGDGADTFVIHRFAPNGAPWGGAPGAGPAPDDGFFGVVFDFSRAQGDRIVNGQGLTVRLSPHPDGGAEDPSGDHGTDQAADHGGDLRTFTTATGPAPPLTRVEVDLDGDGVNDGYILVGPGGPPHHDDPPITATAHGPAGDIFG